MNKKTMFISLGVCAAAGAGYFLFKVFKEFKKQLNEMKEASEYERNQLEEQLRIKDGQLESATNMLHQVMFDPDDVEIPNPEMDEMRARLTNSNLAPTEDEDFHLGAQQTIEHHNVWEENEHFHKDDNNIPYFVVEASKDFKKNGGQSMRHDIDPNSREAWDQYKAVMITELYDEGPVVANNTSHRYNLGILISVTNIDAIIDRFSELLEVNDTRIVQPYNSFDNNIFEDVYERRRDFFGDDTFYSSTEFPVTFGEIVYEFAKKVEEDTEAGTILAFATYILHEAGLLDAETIEQRLLIISRIMEHRNIQDLGNNLFKISMFGRVINAEFLSDLTGHDIRLYTEYNEMIGRMADADIRYEEDDE